jgi:hypothetical protein
MKVPRRAEARPPSRPRAGQDFLSRRPQWGQGSDFARRHLLYARLDRHVRSRTRFCPAAALVNEVLAHLFRRLPIGVSHSCYVFLNQLGAWLEPLNLRYAGSIRDGRLCGPWLDRALVRFEQEHAQLYCYRWVLHSGMAWRRVRRELNDLVNAHHPVTQLAPRALWSPVGGGTGRGAKTRGRARVLAYWRLEKYQ